MMAKSRKETFVSDTLLTLLFCTAGAAFICGFGYLNANINDEKGTVVKKERGAIHVDVDGDNKADRVLTIWQNDVAFYEYAQPGDRISYNNSRNARQLRVNDDIFGRNAIRSINGQSASDIKAWYVVSSARNGR